MPLWEGALRLAGRCVESIFIFCSEMFFLDLKLFCITFGKRIERQVRERKALDVIRLGNLCFGEGWGPKVPMSLSHLAAFSFLDTLSLNLVSRSSAHGRGSAGAQLPNPEQQHRAPQHHVPSPAAWSRGLGGSPHGAAPAWDLCSTSTAPFLPLFSPFPPVSGSFVIAAAEGGRGGAAVTEHPVTRL